MELGKTQGEEDLKRLLGDLAALPDTTPGDQSANGASDSSPSPNLAVSTGSNTRIERAATRDPVGDQVKTAKTLKCTFPGTVEIEAKRFLESGIRLVECPNCANTRTLSPRNGVLRFPSHDKCKTHTPNTEQRWAMGKQPGEWLEDRKRDERIQGCSLCATLSSTNSDILKVHTNPAVHVQEAPLDTLAMPGYT